MHLPIDTLLQGGKYKIVRFIDSGGFGCTYEAEHVMLEKRVAIKEFFVKDFCNRDEATAHVTVGTQSKKGLVHKLRQKFVDEARAICKLHHPGIVTVSDVFEENGTAYFVMDYVEGRSLGEIVGQDGPLSEAKALYYIRQIADALQYVHEHNRLHLDIKPGNIMIDDADRAILIDFGASKQYDEQDGENTSTLMGKTPGYAPLEQMGNDVVKFLPATDIYALGATLYKLLTGITPLSANLLASGEELSPLPTGITASTRQAIAEAMQINKNKRPQSVEAFLNILGSVASTTSTGKTETEETLFAVEVEDIPASPKPTVTFVPSQPSSSSSSHWKKWVLAVVALLCVGVLYVVSFRSAFDYPIIDDTDSTEFYVDSVEVDSAWVAYVEEPEQISKPTTGTINGYTCIDLGLSVKWADRNVGASSPSDYGSYFAWGETSTKSSYTEENGVTYEKKKSFSDISGNSSYDAARANWGGSWRLPTKAECQELVNKCHWKWTTQGGHNGYKVTGPNGNSIFLPAAGWRGGSLRYGAGEYKYGYYWSSTPYESNAKRAYSLYFSSGIQDVRRNNRYDGRTVRPVLDELLSYSKK